MDAFPEAGPARATVQQGSDRLAPRAPSRVVGKPILSVIDVSLAFGGIRALKSVAFAVDQGEVFSIIGPNGAGKTSMLNVIGGVYRPTLGRIQFDGRERTAHSPQGVARLGVARTFQNVALFKGMTVIDNILVGRHLHIECGFFASALCWGRGEREERRSRQAVQRVIDFLEMDHIRTAAADTLPYGLRKRVELGRALAAEPRLLLLDEPMAGMNAEEKQDMVRFILAANEELGATIILIEHDMGVVMDISDRIVVLNHGEKIAEGRPAEVRENLLVVRAYLGDDYQTGGPGHQVGVAEAGQWET